MLKRGVIVLFAIFLVFAVSFATAETYSISDYNSTLYIVSVSNAVNMYAYEVAFAYTGGESAYSIQQANFLGATGTTYGSKLKSGVLSVYGSRLDNTGVGVSGSGFLFNVSHDLGVSLTLDQSLSIANTTTEVETSYNTDGGVDSVTVTEGSSGGGGGGGGGPLLNVTDVKGFVSGSPKEIAVNVIIDKEQEKILTISNNGLNALVLKVSSSGFDDEVKFEKSITLNPGESKEFKVKIKANKKGVISGRIIFIYSENIVLEIPVIVNTRTENFLFDAGIVISDLYRRIKPGDVLKAQVNLLQVGPKDKVDVTATYQIKDFYGKVYHEESETFYVLDSKELVKSFPTNELPVGKYIIAMEIVYPGAFATSSAQFSVVDSGITSKMLYLIMIGLVFVVIASGFISWIIYQQKSLRKAFRRGK